MEAIPKVHINKTIKTMEHLLICYFIKKLELAMFSHYKFLPN